jgi:hypothetical protein
MIIFYGLVGKMAIGEAFSRESGKKHEKFMLGIIITIFTAGIKTKTI